MKTFIIISGLLFLIVTILYVITEAPLVNLVLTKAQYVEVLYRIMFKNRATCLATCVKAEDPGSFTFFPEWVTGVKGQEWEILMDVLHAPKEECHVKVQFRLYSLILSPKMCIEWVKEYKKVLNEKELPNYEELKIILEDGEDTYFKKLDEELLAPF